MCDSQTRLLFLPLIFLSCLLFAGPNSGQGIPLPPPVDGMRVHFIDVGQGDATLIELPEGSILVDTGGEKSSGFDSVDALDAYLRHFFDRRTDLGSRLDLLVITHAHPDHYRGVKSGFFGQPGFVLETYRPRNVIFNGHQPVKKWIEKYVQSTPDVKTFEVSLDELSPKDGLTNGIIDPFSHDGSKDPAVRVLWGGLDSPSGWCEEDSENENNASVVVRVAYGRASVLLTGDLEEHNRFECPSGSKAGIEHLVARHAQTTSNWLDVDVYQVGHHGSYNGTTDALVQAMSPKIAVLSNGPPVHRGRHSAGAYGHPREETIRELERGVQLCRQKEVDVEMYRRRTVKITDAIQHAIFSTGWDGTVVLFGKSNGFWSSESGTPAVGLCNVQP